MPTKDNSIMAAVVALSFIVVSSMALHHCYAAFGPFVSGLSVVDGAHSEAEGRIRPGEARRGTGE